MQLRWLSAAVIYLGSYLPLSLILLAHDLDFTVIKHDVCLLEQIVVGDCVVPLKHAAYSVSAVLLCSICMAASLFALRAVPKKRRIEITESKHIPADLVNYVIPYVLSFISLDYGDPARLIGFAVFLGWIFWITYRSGQIALNPVLSVLGWKLYEVKYQYFGSTDGFTGRVLSKQILVPGQVYPHGVLQDVMIINTVTEGGALNDDAC